ncbi:MAG: hypothetical protein AAF570_20860 [Bacteroidota bacterium]
MASVLHVLNGEGTAYGFRDSGVDGDYLVWNEALCEGPVHWPADSPEFYAARAAFLKEAYGGTVDEHGEVDDSDKYGDLVLDGVEQLRECGQYDRIVLWFEFDLFCQVNLLYLLKWFHLYPFDGVLEMVSPGAHAEVEPFYGMGQLSPAQLAGVYAERGVIGSELVEAGAWLWDLYAGKDAMALFEAIETIPEGLPHLKEALYAHFGRFPDSVSGMNHVEFVTMRYFVGRAKKPGDLFRAFMKECPVYGFGDLQYFSYLRGLMPDLVRVEGEKLMITEAGDDVCNLKVGRDGFSAPVRWVGGVRVEGNKSPYIYDYYERRLNLAPTST